jgi:hypothetical protein
MLKPDFGDIRRIEWNADRVAWVRHLAEEKKMTAKEIAADIGLSTSQAPRIFELCKRCNIVLSGSGRRGKTPTAPGEGRVYSVAVSLRNGVLLARLAERHSMTPGQVAELLLSAAIETGEPFCLNLLDLEAGQ